MAAQGVSFTILGEPASKANSRRIVTDPATGKPRVIKSAKALDYRSSALQQIPPAARVMYDVPVVFCCRIYYASRRPDLAEELLMDILQAEYATVQGRRILTRRGVYTNDRLIEEKHIFKELDPGNPRAELAIWPR